MNKLKYLKNNLSLIILIFFFVLTALGLYIFHNIIGLRECFSILCAALIILRLSYNGLDKNPHFSLALLIFFLLCILHFLLFESYGYMHFFESLCWISVPLAFYFALGGGGIYFVFVFLAFLWFVNSSLSVYQLLSGKLFVGLPRNINWHASFTLGMTPLILYLTWKFFARKNRALWHFICTSIVLITAFTILKTGSRAAAIASITVLFIYGFIYLRGKQRVLFLKLIILLSFTCLSVLILKFEEFTKIWQYDMRPAMWEGALKLIYENLLLGTGEGRFLSEYTFYRPISYFLRSHHFAHVTEHPHNHLLFIAGCFGIFGAGAYFYLMFCPLIILIRRWKNLSTRTKVVLFSFLAFLICSMFDMTFYQWHNFFVVSILLGYLWRESFPPFGAKIKNVGSMYYDFFPFRALCAFLLFVLCLYSSYVVFKSSVLYYSGHFASEEPQRRAEALHLIQKSIDTRYDFELSLFSAGILAIQDFKDPYMTIYYLKRLQECPNHTIARSNLKMADAKIAMGRRLDALRYLEMDIKAYPISIEALYKKYSIESSLGMNEQAEKTYQQLLWALKLKGLEESDAPIIAKNTYFDNKFEEYKKLKINQR